MARNRGYRRFLKVERGAVSFDAAKSRLETRPVFCQWDAAIRGHVFGLFLSLVLMDGLKRRLSQRGCQLEWADIRRDLAALMEI